MNGASTMIENEESVGLSPKTDNKRCRDDDADDSAAVTVCKLGLKKPKTEDCDCVINAVPIGFRDPLLPGERSALALVPYQKPPSSFQSPIVRAGCSKQFWKAGDYEVVAVDSGSYTGVGMDHVRVHPRFLHSNATSHKWALGAFAELLDNALDEVCNGATYVKVDVVTNKRDSTKMLLVEDNGGGMSPDKMRQCMSLGYSEKSKMANTIGQYGNGFKTSTMRLGADVIVFSRCRGKNGTSPTQSIGLLSYTFLRSTGKEDIVVPIVDCERHGNEWKRLTRASADDWDINLETILQWSPYESKEDLARQFDFLEDQGTRIVIYNIWEDDQGKLELDFDTATDDIQIRGVNRDPKNIDMAKKYPNSRHYLTYRHSLRNYVSIMYLRLPEEFRIILRGKDVDHHNLANDMMMTSTVTYKPIAVADGAPNDSNMVAHVTIGFAKDAKDHIDIQGFNVYHKNRLIKPFWRVWNAAGSDGRGVIGVLEADFVEPAHDKQGFERTTVLSRLEQRLIGMQKLYWNTNCQDIGYAPRRKATKSKTPSPDNDKTETPYSTQNGHIDNTNGPSSNKSATRNLNQSTPLKKQVNTEMTLEHRDDGPVKGNCNTCHKCGEARKAQSFFREDENARSPSSKEKEASNIQLSNSDMDSLINLREENRQLKLKLRVKSEPLFGNLVSELQYLKDKCASLQNDKDKCTSLQSELEKSEKKLEKFYEEQTALINIFQESWRLRDEEEQERKKKYEDETNALKEQLAILQKDKAKCCKDEPV